MTDLTLFEIPERKRPKYGTQNGDVLLHLEDHGSITDRDAYLGLSVRRLAARIHDLRAMGYAIESVPEPHKGGAHSRYVLLQRNRGTP